MAIHLVKGVKVHTNFDYPPIPDRSMDWSAVTDDYDGAEDSSNRNQIGRGPTEQDAIDDLLHLIDESGEAEPEERDHQSWKFDHDRDSRKHSW